jgi:hypothetical protein
MTPQEYIARIEKRREEVNVMAFNWADLFPDLEDPGTRQFQAWQKRYGLDATMKAMEEAIPFMNKHDRKPDAAMDQEHGRMNTDRLCAYITAVMLKTEGGDWNE